MPNGNAYGQMAGVAPPDGGSAPMPGGPPPDAGPPPAAAGAPPAGAAAGDPVLTAAMQLLSGEKGSAAELLDKPALYPQIKRILEAVKQDPAAQQGLAKIGVTPVMLQQFDQELTKRMAGKGASPSAPSWLQPQRR